MLNQVLNVSSGTRQQFVKDAVKMSNIFEFSNFTRCNILHLWWKSFCFVHREFSYESIGDRILKIGPHLPLHKQLAKIKQLFAERCACKQLENFLLTNTPQLTS